MDKINSEERLIRTRINNNLLKVEKENRSIKHLLKLAIESANPDKCRYDYNSFNEIYHDINVYSRCTDRKDLLRTCILLATSRNNLAQENLIDVIRLRLGRITDKDYKYIANIIYLKDPAIVEQVNDFLGYYLDNYTDLHRKYYKKYYGI